MQVDLATDDYGRSHRCTVTVDPNNEIAEEDESNNVLSLRVSLPTRPKQAKDVFCTLI
ncbi:CARDB protein [Kribbella sp. VKM Ac-2568]|nr:CARDB protein [Kribbella sp. VKM Ac-2568]